MMIVKHSGTNVYTYADIKQKERICTLFSTSAYLFVLILSGVKSFRTGQDCCYFVVAGEKFLVQSFQLEMLFIFSNKCVVKLE